MNLPAVSQSLSVDAGELQSAAIFSGLPKFDSITYEGLLEPKIFQFEVTREELCRKFFLHSFMSEDDRLTWKAVCDLLDFSVKTAAQMVKGFYGFEVISAEMDENLRNFQPREFAKLLANHAAAMAPGQKRLIRFTQVYGILHKRIPEQWGKIDLSIEIEATAKARIKQSNYLKKIWKKTIGLHKDSLLLLHDLSAQPPCSPEMEKEPYFFLFLPGGGFFSGFSGM
ncbi:hypothetical protein N9K06_00130 [Omnitrophica bacterium]|nr:hypothetical protein [Candidatus Omnitrophota bacterium]